MGILSALFGSKIVRPDPELKDLHGSGHLFKHGVSDLNQVVSYKYGCNAVVLATNGLDAPKGDIWVLSEEEGHTITIGATRSGKFVSLLAPALMTYQGSVVVLDPKAESAWVCAQRRREMGQRVVILDPWNEVNRRYGDLLGVRELVTNFNPLAHLDSKRSDFADDIASLADALVVTQAQETQPHFPDSARDLIAGIIAALVMKMPGRTTFADVRQLLTESDAGLANFAYRIVRDHPDSLAARKLNRFTSPGSHELSSIRSTAATQTAFLDTETLSRSMHSTADTFDMEELGTEPVSLFVVLPMDKLQTHGRWLRLILTLAIRAIAGQAKPPSPPVLFMLDEMGTVGKLDVVENAFGLLAGQGIRIWGFLQNLTQLQDDYKRWEVFFANASNILLLGVNDNTTAEYFSKYMSTKTIFALKETNTGGRSGTQGNAGWSQTPEYYKREVMLPEEIKCKTDDSIIVLRRGGPYSLMKKSSYYAERRWQGLYRPNPHYMSPAQAADWRLQNPRQRIVEEKPRPRPKPRTRVDRCPQVSCRQSVRLPDRTVSVKCPSCGTRWTSSA